MARNADEWTKKPLLPEGHYVSSKIYTDPNIFEEERAKIMATTWKFVCHESELADPGDYRTLEHAGIPIVVIRGPDNTLRAFLNACSHRGALLVTEPRGNAKNFTCFFHLWSYDYKGACVSITREEGYNACNLKKGDCGLRQVRIAEKLGLVFINLDDDAEDFESHVGDSMDDLIEPMGTVPMEVFHHHRIVVHGNWKQWHETNMELYHEWGHVVNRQTSVAAEGYHNRKWKIHPNGHGSLDPLKVEYTNYKGWDARDNLVLPGLQPGEFRIVDLFPNTTVIIRASVVRIDTSIPIAPGVTLLEQRGLGIKGESAEDRLNRQGDHNEFWGPFGRNLAEDVIFVEAVEKTNRHGASQYGIFAREEELLSQDDEIVRSYYRTWGRYMNRSASDPLRTAAAPEQSSTEKLSEYA
ncbi:putative dioxygenase subunit [Pusillimonas sp. T7-7]|uniref:aromatic ring-hydroxylating oxygenase subunit alpha n=1 Tax=Pusillimonas sp. (strain T7-7) TaxID=1007105 RepID=UPI00020848BE|nr:aromatic ring-hydroxylating dioxygenase subunit alpha [Pusillimonas sp. T7-7]AEC21006.1 putative dioxygenase subunit [Pusillimonas sp. T7-7]